MSILTLHLRAIAPALIANPLSYDDEEEACGPEMILVSDNAKTHPRDQYRRQLQTRYAVSNQCFESDTRWDSCCSKRVEGSQPPRNPLRRGDTAPILAKRGKDRKAPIRPRSVSAPEMTLTGKQECCQENHPRRSLSLLEVTRSSRKQQRRGQNLVLHDQEDVKSNIISALEKLEHICPDLQESVNEEGIFPSKPQPLRSTSSWCVH